MKKNNDLAGWLAIEDTVIDYPVMQCDDNDFYLHHDFEKRESKYGELGEEDFLEFYQNIKDMSLYDTGVDAVYGDTLLMLSTCAYHVKNGRFVIVAKRIP